MKDLIIAYSAITVLDGAFAILFIFGLESDYVYYKKRTNLWFLEFFKAVRNYAISKGEFRINKPMIISNLKHQDFTFLSEDIGNASLDDIDNQRRTELAKQNKLSNIQNMSNMQSVYNNNLKIWKKDIKILGLIVLSLHLLFLIFLIKKFN